MIDKRNLALSLSLNYFFKREKQLKVPEALPPQKAEHVFFLVCKQLFYLIRWKILKTNQQWFYFLPYCTLYSNYISLDTMEKVGKAKYLI